MVQPPKPPASAELPAEFFATREAEQEAARQIPWPWQPHRRQSEILAASERFLVAFCGRRFGKTMIAIRWIVEEALRTGGMTWWVAPTYAAAMRAWREMLKFVPRQFRTVFKADRRIELAGGGMIEFHSADNPEALRGEGLTAAVVDEAAYVDDTVWLDVLSPMFLTTQGRVLVITTPKAKYGWAWWMFRAGQQGELGHRAWNCSTADNPFVPREEIARLRRALPADTFQREVLAQALDALNNPLAGVAQVATAQPDVPRSGGRYFVGVDWGRSTDFTVLVCLLETGDGTARQVAMERFTGVRYKAQMQRLREFVAHWQPVAVHAEVNNMGGPLVELLQDEGLPLVPFHTTASSKEPLIRQLQLAVEQQSVELLADPVLIAEFQQYEEEIDTTVTRFAAPDRQHDDTVIAAALALQLLQGAPGGGRGALFDGEVTDYLLPAVEAPGDFAAWDRRMAA